MTLAGNDDTFGDIPHEPIDDATALALRDGIVAAMIADACQWMPPFRLLALGGASPFVHMAVSRNG